MPGIVMMPGIFFSIDDLQLVRLGTKSIITVLLLLSGIMQSRTIAGESGLNVVIIANQASSNSLALANYYAEKRSVPPQNILRIQWNGGNTSWTLAEFQTNLAVPLQAMLASRQLTNQARIIVLSMDIPFVVTGSNNLNGTTSALYYGFKSLNWSDQISATNSYAASESSFVAMPPVSATSRPFLTTMITSGSLTQAMRLVDQGVSSDSTFPQRPVLLAKSGDYIRNIRYRAFDNAMFNIRLNGGSICIRTNQNYLWGQTNLLGYATGLGYFSVSSGTFLPGAMADSLSSYAGVIFGPNSQTSLLAFIGGGACGSYGTVTEPQPLPEKFPDPQNYFYQARGFTLAECYYQSLTNPHQGLIVGEPLAAPFAKPGSATWLNLPVGSQLSGITNLSVQIAAADVTRRIQQVDLFIDGRFHSTLTNFAPAPGNELRVTIKGRMATTTIRTNATLASIASALCDSINAASNSSLTKIFAIPHGDRVELQSTIPSSSWQPWETIINTTNSPATTSFQARRLSPPVSGTLTVPGVSSTQAFQFEVNSTSAGPFVIQASSDLKSWMPVAASASDDSFTFADTFARFHPSRFYRLSPASTLNLTMPPRLQMLGKTSNGFELYVEAPTGQPFEIQSSTNLDNWQSLSTNLTGGSMLFTDDATPTTRARFYRTRSSPVNTNLSVTIAATNIAGAVLLSVSDPLQMPAVIYSSTDQIQWSPIQTNLAPADIPVSVQSLQGTAAVLNCFLQTARSNFLHSTAQGIRQSTLNGVIQAGSTLTLTVTKTNGAVVSIVHTNLDPFATIEQVAQQFISIANASSKLAGPDGLIIEDLVPGFMGNVTFNLRARSPGFAASQLKARLIGSGLLMAGPSVSSTLDENISDLRPRNHLYITAGTTNLTQSFLLNTTTLPDGHHELTVVAYEGTNVRTQTRSSVRVRIKNSPLDATLTITNATSVATVNTNLQIIVTSNTNNIQTIRLFSTGGEIASTTNQSSALFTVAGTSLGSGLHPFYAELTTTNGLAFRTSVQSIRLASP